MVDETSENRYRNMCSERHDIINVDDVKKTMQGIGSGHLFHSIVRITSTSCWTLSGA